jgi:hypothetical protein
MPWAIGGALFVALRRTRAFRPKPPYFKCASENRFDAEPGVVRLFLDRLFKALALDSRFTRASKSLLA